MWKVTNANVRSGTYAFFGQSSIGGSAGYIMNQTIPLVIGTKYQVTYWIAQTGDYGTTFNAGINDGSRDYFYNSGYAPFPWYPSGYSFIATNIVGIIKFKGSNYNAGFGATYIDDISVVSLTSTPTMVPTLTPSSVPTLMPTVVPAATPTGVPSAIPSTEPSAIPTVAPSVIPSAIQSAEPSAIPTVVPSVIPSAIPSAVPTEIPSVIPTEKSSVIPTSVLSYVTFPSDQPISVIGTSSKFKIVISFPAANYLSGDGFFNVVISSSRKKSSYVVFGQDKNLTDLNLETLLPKQGYIINYSVGYDNTFRSVSIAGDINGDGYDNIIVSASYGRIYKVYVGISYVIFGKASGFTNINLANLTSDQGFAMYGSTHSTFNGISLAHIGDVNGDGYANIAISSKGSSYQGITYIIFGKSSGFANIYLNNFSPFDGFTITGAKNSNSGVSIDGVKDFNGDGIDDFLIGSATYFKSYTTQITYLIYGQKDGFTNIYLTQLTSSQGAIFNGGGVIVTGIGDNNGDGRPDILISNISIPVYNAAFVLVYPEQLTYSPSAMPTESRIIEATENTTNDPSFIPTGAPTKPTMTPTLIPTGPTSTPTSIPSSPTFVPTLKPSAVRTFKPSSMPTVIPTVLPSIFPSAIPTRVLTFKPSFIPTTYPTTMLPTILPTVTPSAMPTAAPTNLRGGLSTVNKAEMIVGVSIGGVVAIVRAYYTIKYLLCNNIIVPVAEFNVNVMPVILQKQNLANQAVVNVVDIENQVIKDTEDESIEDEDSDNENNGDDDGAAGNNGGSNGGSNSGANNGNSHSDGNANEEYEGEFSKGDSDISFPSDWWGDLSFSIEDQRMLNLIYIEQQFEALDKVLDYEVNFTVELITEIVMPYAAEAIAIALIISNQLQIKDVIELAVVDSQIASIAKDFINLNLEVSYLYDSAAYSVEYLSQLSGSVSYLSLG